MDSFLLALEWFFYGLITGFFLDPVIKLLTTIKKEAKIAASEWRNPNK